MLELSPHDALKLLQWYVDAGVDEALQDEPRDYFMPQAAPVTPQAVEALVAQVDRQPMALPAAATALHHAPSAAIAKARTLADNITSLAQL